MDAPVVAVPPRMRGEQPRARRVAGRAMEVAVSSLSSWRGRLRRMECGGAPGDPVEHGALDSLHETTEHEA